MSDSVLSTSYQKGIKRGKETYILFWEVGNRQTHSVMLVVINAFYKKKKTRREEKGAGCKKEPGTVEKHYPKGTC